MKLMKIAAAFLLASNIGGAVADDVLTCTEAGVDACEPDCADWCKSEIGLPYNSRCNTRSDGVGRCWCMRNYNGATVAQCFNPPTDANLIEEEVQEFFVSSKNASDVEDDDAENDPTCTEEGVDACEPDCADWCKNEIGLPLYSRCNTRSDGVGRCWCMRKYNGETVAQCFNPPKDADLNEDEDQEVFITTKNAPDVDESGAEDVETCTNAGIDTCIACLTKCDDWAEHQASCNGDGKGGAKRCTCISKGEVVFSCFNPGYYDGADANKSMINMIGAALRGVAN